MTEKDVCFAVGAFLVCMVFSAMKATKVKNEHFIGAWVVGTSILYALMWGFRLLIQSLL